MSLETLDLLESMRTEQADIAGLLSERGYQRTGRGRRDPEHYRRVYLPRLITVVKIYEGAMNGDLRDRYLLREALSTSDFPQIFGDILDRQMLGNYQEAPASWPMYAKRKTVSDFRTVKRFVINGGESVLSTVPQGTPYPDASISDEQYSYSVKKYGRVIPLVWEALINDDLDAIKDIPARFGRAARRTEEKVVTELFVDSSGPHASMFTSGNKNIINTTNGASATNPALSVAGLQDGMTVLAKQLDSDSEPIMVDAVTLVVGPALIVTALNILNSTELRPKTSGGATSAQELIAQNWMKNKIRLAVNYYIPRVATTNGDTTWFLFADPAVGRPALELGFLKGHETPELFMKTPNAQRVGGGAVNPMDGDFDSDAIEYKIRHVLGGVRLEPKSAVSSNGSGS